MIVINAGLVYFSGADQLNFISVDGGSNQFQLTTNMKFRDLNGWYNIILAWDTTLGSSGDRCRIYVNGAEVSLGTESQPSQNTNIYFGVGGSNYPIYIGRRGDASNYFDG